MVVKQVIVSLSLVPNKDLSNARILLGRLLHTLQDFYSHSNWIEMGKTYINIHIGKDEIIGRVAAPNQSACRNESCIKIEKSCVSKHKS
jgi:hypothetical protein